MRALVMTCLLCYGALEIVCVLLLLLLLLFLETSTSPDYQNIVSYTCYAFQIG